MSMLESQPGANSQPGLKKVIAVIFGFLLLYFGIQLASYHYLLVTFPYPLEYREGAVLFTTNLMLEGENPFDLQNMPTALNVYGINYHWVVYPFAKLWGATFGVHRTVSAVFILISLVLFFLILLRHKVDALYSLSAVLLLYASLLYRYTPLARPDGVGFCLFLLGVYIVYLGQYSTVALIFSVVCGVLAFYTKPYFVLVIPYVAAYLFLFVSKQKATLYGILSLILLLFTAAVVNAFYETYFLNTFINHINATTNDMDYLGLQLTLFWTYNSGVILILLVFVFLFMLNKLVGKSESNPNFAATLHALKKRIDILNFRKPLLEQDFPLSLFCLILSFVVFYFKLGRHIGNMMTYAYQLITPFLLIYTFTLFSLPLNNFRLAKVTAKYNYIVLVPGIVLSLFLLYSSASSLKDSAKWVSMNAWQKVEEISLPYKNILNSPVLTALLIEQKKSVYDNGQTEYFQYSQYSYDWLAGVLPSNSAILMQWNKYQDTIIQTMENKGFDAVIVDTVKPGTYYEGLQDYYHMTDTLEICMFHSVQCIQLEIWEPN